MKWDNLTMSQKQALMKIYVNNGITNLNEIVNHYNRFAEGGPVESTELPKTNDRSLIHGHTSYINNSSIPSERLNLRPTPGLLTDANVGAGINLPFRELIDRFVLEKINTPNIIDTDSITRPVSYITRPRRINRFDDGGHTYTIEPIDFNESFDNYTRAALNSILKDTTPSGYERSIIATSPNGEPVRIFNLENEELPEGYTKGHTEYENRVLEARKNLDYIGGDEESRYTIYLSKVPKLTNLVDSLSKVYSINPNIMYERLGQEGLLDREIELYNEHSTKEEQKNVEQNLFNRGVSAFGTLGLDTAGELLNKGLLDMKWQNENLGYSNALATNEKGQVVQTIDVPNLESGLEVKAAMIEYLTNIIKQKYPNASPLELDALINGAYNLGQYHKDLKDVEYISTRYNVSPWNEYLMKEKFPNFKFKTLKTASLEEELKKNKK